MSAFLCSPKHIAVVATWAAESGLVEDREAAARQFAEANIKSVSYRYSEEEACATQEWLSMELDDYLEDCAKPVTGYAVAQIHSLASSLDYQSCEHPEWETSEAKRIIDAVLTDTSVAPAGKCSPVRRI